MDRLPHAGLELPPESTLTTAVVSIAEYFNRDVRNDYTLDTLETEEGSAAYKNVERVLSNRGLIATPSKGNSINTLQAPAALNWKKIASSPSWVPQKTCYS